MQTNLKDLLGLCEIPVNTVPVWNGCERDFFTPINIYSCGDVRGCIDCDFIGGLLNSGDNSIIINGCRLSVDPDFIDDSISASINGCVLSIGNVDFNICGILSNLEFSFFDKKKTIKTHNNDIVRVQGVEGMRSIIDNATSERRVGFPEPVPAQNGAVYYPRNKWVVLTWNGDTCLAEWMEIACCPQTLEFNESSNILCISGLDNGYGGISNGNCVDLSSINTDSQTLSLQGDDLTISNGNTISLASIDHQNLVIEGNDANGYYISLTNTDCCDKIYINLTDIDTCNDVQECMDEVILSLQNQIIFLQQQVLILNILLLRRKYWAHRWLNADVTVTQGFNGILDVPGFPASNILFQSFGGFTNFDGFSTASINMDGPNNSIRVPKDGLYRVRFKGNTLANRGLDAFRVILIAVNPANLDYKVMLDWKLGGDITSGSRSCNNGMYKETKEYHISSSATFKIPKDRLVFPVLRLDSNVTRPLFNPCGGDVTRALNTGISCTGPGSCSLVNNTVTLPPIPPCPPAYASDGFGNYPAPRESGPATAELIFKSAGLAAGVPAAGTDLSDERSGWMFGIEYVNRLSPGQLNTP